MIFISRRRQRARLLLLVVIVLFIWSTSTFYVGNKATDIMVHQTNDIRELEQTISTTAENLKSHKQHVYPDQSKSPHVTDQTQQLPLIYVITPTVYRPEQKADLTRTSHTLRLVPRIHWIVIEDREKRSKRVAKFLKRSEVSYTHLAEQTDLLDIAMLKIKDQLKLGWEMPKGVQQRNAALKWIRNHGEYPSVFYFADDDNTYDLQLFEEMRYTRKVSVWPVGLIGMAMFQTPVVNNGKVIGWAAGWIFNRTFPIDMAGFAVNSDVLKRDDPPMFSMEIGKGFIETNFIEQLNVTIEELEPKADNCTQDFEKNLNRKEIYEMLNQHFILFRHVLHATCASQFYESLAEFLHLTEKLFRGKGGSVAVSVLKELSNVKKLPYACIQDLFTSLRDAAFVYQPSTTVQPDNSKTCLFKQTVVDEWSKQKAELKKLIKQHMDPVVNLKEYQKKCWQSKVKMNEYASMLEAAQLSLPYNSDDPNEYKARVLAIKGLKKDLSSKQRRHTRNLTAYGELLEIESKIRIEIVEIADSLRCRITERITEKLQEALKRLQAVSALPVHFDPALISASVYDLTSRIYMFDEPTTEVSSVAIMRPLTMESQYNFADDQNTYAPYDYTGTVKEQCVEYTEDYLKLKEGDSVKLKMIARGGRTGFGWTKPSRFSTKRWGFFPVTKVAIDYHTSNR